MAPEVDNNIIVSELLKAIRQLQITSTATSEALTTTSTTLAITVQVLAATNATLATKAEDLAITKTSLTTISEALVETNLALAACPTSLFDAIQEPVSKVSKSLYEMISASVVWSRLFKAAFGPDVLLDTLPAIPESKSYMLYMCAVSSRVCEQCLSYSVPCRLSNGPADLVERPLPVLIPDAILGRRGRREPNTAKFDFLTVSPEPESSINSLDPTQRSHSSILIQKRDEEDRKRGVGYVGKPINRTWKVLFCLRCRQAHYLDYPEEVPTHTLGKFMSFRRITEVYGLAGHQIGFLPMREEGDVPVYSEEVTYRVYQRNYGGNVGLDPPFSIDDQERRTCERIETYCQL